MIGLRSRALLETDPREISKKYEVYDEPNHLLDFDRLPGNTTLKTGRPAQASLHFRPKADQRFTWCLVRAVPLFDDRKVMVGVLNTIQETTRIQKALREREETLKLALRSGRMGIWDWEILKGRLTWTNSYSIFGLKKGEFSGRLEDYWKLIHPKDRYRIRRAINQAVEKDEDYQAEYRVIWPDGSVHWLWGKGEVQFDRTGEALRMVGINMDITDDKQAEEEIKQKEKKFKAVFDTALDVFIILDSQMRIKDINKAGCELLGKNKRRLLNKRLIKFVTLETREEVNARWRLFLRKGKQRGEWDILAPDETDRTVEYNVTADFFSGQHLFVFRDITDYKIEEKRREHFLSIASHELRSPLASIKAFAQMLRRSLKDKGDEKVNSYIAKIDNKADVLASLISDLLDVTRIRQGKLVLFPEVFDFDMFLLETVEDLQMTIKSHRIIVEGRTHKQIYADKNRLGQVLSNLVRNAVKYSPDADKVIIKMSTIADSVVLSVQDFGLGISKKDQTRIFDLYFRGSDRKKNNISGLGMGLFITWEIIRQHKGKIWVESKKGKGSTFYVNLTSHPKRKLVRP